MGHLHATKDTWLALQRRADKTQSGLPPTPELQAILQHLFTEQEAEIAARLPVVPRPLSKIARRYDMPLETLRAHLDRMADKGLVFDFPHPSRGTFYMLAPPIIGFFEFSMMRVRADIDQKKVAGLLSTYLYERPDFLQEIARARTPIGRTLVHEDSVEPEVPDVEILDIDRATRIVRNAKLGAISLCYCRHKMEHLGKACGKPVDVCMSLDTGAEFILRHGHGRRAETSELLEILDRCRKEQLVQIADNVQRKPSYICNCCGCCCGQLAAINRHGLKTAVATSGFLARPDQDTCTGCGRCARACPVRAISVRPRPLHEHAKAQMHAEVDESICLGCGVCQPACTKNAMHMAPRARRMLTPEDTLERVLRMALGRGNLHSLLFDEEDGPTSALANRLVGAIERMPAARRAMLDEQLKSRFVSFLCRVARKDPRMAKEIVE